MRIALADAPGRPEEYAPGCHLGVRPVAGGRDGYHIVSARDCLATIRTLLGPGSRGVHTFGPSALVFMALTHSPL